jgi:hypothetical protein
MPARLILHRLTANPMATWLSATTLLWGLFVALPLDTFGASPSWNAVRELGLSEVVVGSIVAGVGIFKFAALLLDHVALRRLAAMVCAVTWGFFSVMFIRSNVGGTGTVIYPMLVVAVGVDYLVIRWKEHRLRGQK